MNYSILHKCAAVAKLDLKSPKSFEIEIRGLSLGIILNKVVFVGTTKKSHDSNAIIKLQQ